jgi:AcrR family transcriptional regulator
MPKPPFELLPSRQRKKIFRAAIDLVADHGYRRTTIKMITKRLHVADGYLHYYFEGKEDLVRWAIEIGMDQWLSHYKRHVHQQNPQNIYEWFRLSVRQMVQFVSENRTVFAAYRQLVRDLDFPLLDYLAGRVSWIENLYAEVLARDIAGGLVRSDVPPELIAGILDFINTRLQEFAFNADEDPTGIWRVFQLSDEAVLDNIISILRDGIAPKPAGVATA